MMEILNNHTPFVTVSHVSSCHLTIPARMPRYVRLWTNVLEMYVCSVQPFVCFVQFASLHVLLVLSSSLCSPLPPPLLSSLSLQLFSSLATHLFLHFLSSRMSFSLPIHLRTYLDVTLPSLLLLPLNDGQQCSVPLPSAERSSLQSLSSTCVTPLQNSTVRQAQPLWEPTTSLVGRTAPGQMTFHRAFLLVWVTNRLAIIDLVCMYVHLCAVCVCLAC